MARTVKAFKIGLFVLICVAIGIGLVIWLVAASYLQGSKTYVCYFSESVKGLQPDAVVNFRGLAIGRVATLGLAPDGRLIEIELKLKPDFPVGPDIAIQLQTQGLTGLQYLEIDAAPKDIDQLTPKLNFQAKYPIIRSFPSELAQLKFALQDIYDKIMGMDVKSLTDSWIHTSELVNNLLEQFGAGSETGDLRETVAALKRTAQSSAALIERFSAAASQAGVNKGFQDFSAALANTRQASESLSDQLRKLPPGALAKLTEQMTHTVQAGGETVGGLGREFGDTALLLKQNLEQLKVLISQLTSLTQGLREQPNRLLFKPEESDPFKKK